MSVVFKALDTQLNRTVALKFLAFHLGADEQFKKRFMREARAVAALHHQNICYIHEISETQDGQLFIAMAYYNGKTLKQIIAEGALSEHLAVDYFLQILNGLASAHDAGIIHRDLKPGNVIITTEGVAKIIDFGLAKIEGGTQITRQGAKVGTPIYMSPEQVLDSAVDHRSDIWAAGILFYEMLTGKHPFLKEDDLSTIHSVMNDEVKPLNSTSFELKSDLEHIVQKALSKDLEQRYQTVQEIIEAVTMTYQNNSGRTSSEASRIRQPLFMILVILSVGVLLSLLIYGTWLLFS